MKIQYSDENIYGKIFPYISFSDMKKINENEIEIHKNIIIQCRDILN